VCVALQGLWGPGHGGFGGMLSDCEVPEAMLPAEDAVVLDCVVERKDVCDLASSIVGKRYDSQKARLLQVCVSVCASMRKCQTRPQVCVSVCASMRKCQKRPMYVAKEAY